ncbi:ADP-ribosyltransferase-containing protein [Rubrivivax gelatinosus]|uniref:ADP-ribosyltransferase-containing protein n=1 Tax=Rubrivivax gelatinosus TaxID=28068 RepID=UPI0002E28CCD|nr:hypothetical protein [Rubrivivax gelatinosus]MBG6083117.1 hypothetical protein [Rubrivivax gelatinosus]
MIKTKVVGDDGLPMLVFHGTNVQFETFEASSKGCFGRGIYFADSRDSAIEYGAIVVRAHVALVNPWEVAADCDGEVNFDEDFDGPAAAAVLALPQGRPLLEQAKKDRCGHFGASLQAHLVAMGHDGIIATYPDGSREVVAFEADQVHVVDRSPA